MNSWTFGHYTVYRIFGFDVYQYTSVCFLQDITYAVWAGAQLSEVVWARAEGGVLDDGRTAAGRLSAVFYKQVYISHHTVRWVTAWSYTGYEFQDVKMQM